MLAALCSLSIHLITCWYCLSVNIGTGVYLLLLTVEWYLSHIHIMGSIWSLAPHVVVIVIPIISSLLIELESMRVTNKLGTTLFLIMSLQVTEFHSTQKFLFTLEFVLEYTKAVSSALSSLLREHSEWSSRNDWVGRVRLQPNWPNSPSSKKTSFEHIMTNSFIHPTHFDPSYLIQHVHLLPLILTSK